jgi:hypothetical protein
MVNVKNRNLNLPRMRRAIQILKDAETLKRDHDYTAWVCGTVACAGGMLALDRNFQKQGLGLVRFVNWRHDPGNTPAFNGMEGDDALSSFLGLDIANDAFVNLSEVYGFPEEPRNIKVKHVRKFLEKQLADYARDYPAFQRNQSAERRAALQVSYQAQLRQEYVARNTPFAPV